MATHVPESVFWPHSQNSLAGAELQWQTNGLARAQPSYTVGLSQSSDGGKTRDSDGGELSAGSVRVLTVPTSNLLLAADAIATGAPALFRYDDDANTAEAQVEPQEETKIAPEAAPNPMPETDYQPAFLLTRKTSENSHTDDARPAVQRRDEAGHLSASEERWIGAEGEIVRLGGVDHRLFNVYVGSRAQSQDNLALIDTDLPLDTAASDSAGEFCTWEHLYPQTRLELLAWIGCGRAHSNVSTGALYFYFHGLERRLLVDCERSEAAEIKAELEALREVFSHLPHFIRSADKLIQVCHQLEPSLLPVQLPRLEPNLELTVSHECRLYCAKMMARWGSLDASDALVLKTNQPGFRFDGHVLRHLEYLEEAWYLGFRDFFPENLVIAPTAGPVRLVYEAVNGAFWKELVSDLADPCVAAPPPELDQLFDICVEALEQYRDLDRRRRGGCLEIAARKFRSRSPEPGAILAIEPTRQKLEALLGDGPLAVLSVAQLLGTICSGGYRKNGPVPRTVMQQLRSTFCSLSFAFEPDPDFSASLPLKPDTQIALFRAPEGGVVDDSRAFQLAHAAVTLSCYAASSYPALEPVDVENLLRALPRGDTLTNVEVRRLIALRAAMAEIAHAPSLLKAWVHSMIRLGHKEELEQIFELAFSGRRRTRDVERFARQLCLALGRNRADAEFFWRHVPLRSQSATVPLSRSGSG